jgi:hypothetical protein
VLVAGGTDGTVVHEHSELLEVWPGGASSLYLHAIPGVRDHSALITGGCNVLITGGTTDVEAILPTPAALFYASPPPWGGSGAWYQVTAMPSARASQGP